MIPFDFKARSGANLTAHYAIENGKLIVSYRDETASAAAGVNEIANAFLRDNLMRSLLGEIDPPRTAANDGGLQGPSAA
jgi:hypothetical protein